MIIQLYPEQIKHLATRKQGQKIIGYEIKALTFGELEHNKITINTQYFESLEPMTFGSRDIPLYKPGHKNPIKEVYHSYKIRVGGVEFDVDKIKNQQTLKKAGIIE